MNNMNMYDLIIIGGGPAGVSAGVYSARKKLKTAIITDTFGGQSTESLSIENWIGVKSMSGAEFGKILEDHLRSVANDCVDIFTGDKVKKIDEKINSFRIETESGLSLESRTILITVGSKRRKLDAIGSEHFENRGVTYCASCDGPLFSGQDVAVVGGGNAGFESASQLLAYTKSVTLFNRGIDFKADPSTVLKVLSHPNMKVIKNAEILELKGSNFLQSIIYTDPDGKHELKVTGLFVEIGLIPATKFLEDIVDLNKYGQIIINHKNQRTSKDGIWAAGDATDVLYHQNNIASGDAVKALEDIYLYLRAK